MRAGDPIGWEDRGGSHDHEPTECQYHAGRHPQSVFELDAGFGTGGKVLTQLSKIGLTFASDFAIQPDGKILMAGHALTPYWWPFPPSDRYDFAVAWYLPDGRLDPTFGRRGVVVEAVGNVSEDEASAMALQSDGRILVVGSIHVRYPSDIGLLRLNADGTRDRTFGTRGQVITPWNFANHGNSAAGVAIQRDGKILVIGIGMLLRYLPDGQLDSGFGDGGVIIMSIGSGIALQPDGKILLQNVHIGRYLPDGRLDPDFGGTGLVTTRAGSDFRAWSRPVLQRDGKVLVAGSSEIGGQRRFTVIRYNPDGSLDTTFGDPE